MSRTINLRGKSQDASGGAGPMAATADDGPPTHATHYAFLSPPVEADEIGRLGTYRVLQLLGQGGMAFVFEAEDVALRRTVALKVMKPDLDPNDPGWDRFLREARLMASITHEHVVTVFQVGQEGRVPFLVMELLRGQSLDEWMKQTRKIGVPAVLRLGGQIAAGLAGIHGHGLIHRDVKPANIWLEAPKGRVKILDFGLARVAEDNAHLTQSGMIVGTPSYMSPEQARGETLDARSDLFSLGCVLYELCCGARPFQAPTTMAVLTALAVSDPRPVHELRPNIPKDLSNLIMRLLAKAPEERPASAEAVIARLQKIEGRLNSRTTAPQPISATHPQLPTKVVAPTRLKKVKAAQSRRIRMVVGVCLLVVVLAVGLTAGLASFLPPGPPHRDAAAPPPPPPAMYLSDMKPVDDNNPVKAMPAPPPLPGQPPPPSFVGVRVHDQLFPHAIFMHPPTTPNGGEASLRYNLGGRYGTFTAETSLNDGPAQSDTPLTFSVLGDGQLLWQSPRPLRTQADAERCTISVKEVDYLTIRVNCPGFPRGAHAVWIDPKVTP